MEWSSESFDYDKQGNLLASRLVIAGCTIASVRRISRTDEQTISVFYNVQFFPLANESNGINQKFRTLEDAKKAAETRTRSWLYEAVRDAGGPPFIWHPFPKFCSHCGDLIPLGSSYSEHFKRHQ